MERTPPLGGLASGLVFLGMDLKAVVAYTAEPACVCECFSLFCVLCVREVHVPWPISNRVQMCR